MTRISSFVRDETGTSSIEFVLVFPAFILVLLSAVEAGTMMLRNVWLERGVDMAVRDIRIGINAPADENELITSVCNYAAFIRECDQILRLELVRVDTENWVMPTGNVTCKRMDELTQPPVDYDTAVDQDVMLVRACAMFNPYFPTTGLGLSMPKDPRTGLYAITASSAFVVEPA